MKYLILITLLFTTHIAWSVAKAKMECANENGNSIQRDVQELVYSDLEDLKSDYCLALEMVDFNWRATLSSMPRTVTSIEQVQSQTRQAMMRLDSQEECKRYSRLVMNIMKKEHNQTSPIDCEELERVSREKREKELRLAREKREKEENIAREKREKEEKVTRDWEREEAERIAAEKFRIGEEYFSGGQLKVRTSYQSELNERKEHYFQEIWYVNGQMKSQARYLLNGNREGLFKQWTMTGDLILELCYEDGEQTSILDC